MENENTRELFDVDEASLATILDVNAESNEPQGESSASVESVELTDAEGEGQDDTAEVVEEVAPESETVEEEKPEEETEQEAEEAEASDPESIVEKDGKVYSFKDAPKEMRAVFDAHTALTKAFVRDDIEKVEAELKQLSPSSFSKLEQTIVQRSAEANADKWAEYLVSVKPEAVKQSLFGDAAKGVNLEVIKELANLFTEASEEGEELRTILELRNPEFAANAKPKLTPEEKKELEELRQQKADKDKADEAAQISSVFNSIFDYVDDTAVVPKIKELGFAPDPNDSPEQSAAKKRIVSALASTIMAELQSDPETKDDYAKVMSKIEARDKSGAMALIPSLMEKAEEITVSYLGFIKSQQTASLKQKHTPAKKPPTAIAPASKTPPPPPKPRTLTETLETASDEEILRNMGLAAI